MDARTSYFSGEIKQLKLQVRNLIKSVNEIDKELTKLREDKNENTNT